MAQTSHLAVDRGNLVRICQNSSFEVYLHGLQFIQNDVFEDDDGFKI
jgi:hypothetical protein